MYGFVKYALLFFFCAILAKHTSAQKKDNLGKEYYLAFGPNQGGRDNENAFTLFLTGPVAASVTIELPALSYLQKFNVTPGEVTKVLLPSGANFGSTVEVTASETVIKGMGIHVLANTEIAVYGMNHKLYSSDAFMALPIEVLGKGYRTLNYQSSLASLGGSPSNLPGQFWIVGTEDSTDVIVTPNDTTSSGRPPHEPFSVRLDRGDVYLVQGNADKKGNDLTGSLIESDKPIAVFSGHMRAGIPEGFNNIGSNQPSRDHLVEQLPSIDRWGSEMIVVPYESSDSPDVVRILSATNGNIVTINNDTSIQLNEGKFYEISALREPAIIRSESPVLVGQYMHSSLHSITTSGDPYGDPAFSLVPPLIHASGRQYVVVVGDPTSIKSQFLTIVSIADSLKKLTVDSITMASSYIKTIGTSEYGYVSLKISPGVHTVSLNAPYSMNVYGLGNVDSYSYGVWLLTEPLNSVTQEVADEGEMLQFGDIFPNPMRQSKDGIVLPFFAKSNLVLSWSICSVEGAICEKGEMNIIAGKGEISVAASKELSNGTYFLYILAEKQESNMSERCTYKFIVVR